MRFSEKKQILEGLCKLKEIHHPELLTSDRETLEILMDCQILAMELGEKIEASVQHCDNVIHKLEEYCEEIYFCSLNQSSLNERVEVLNQKIEFVFEQVKAIKTKYLMFFMPYKASMWDSLESIWIAAKEDESVTCVVMPIPYYGYDSEKKKLIYYYEGNQFPDYVPITDYRKVKLEEEQPEVIFIHNPYDDANFVTSVPECYFSRELKNNTKYLIYVPYYVTKGTISQAQSNLPVYANMDYMIAQSEYFKEGTDKLYFADKVVALGSPKFDRVVNGCKKRKSTEKALKRVMLNTSLNCFLRDADAYLRKLSYVFHILEKRKDVVLVWRPHPLLESTIQSLRPQMKEKYEQLKKDFVEHQIGVMDDSADVTDAIVNCDAYIGEAESSIVSLFAVADKPVFILNNYLNREETLEEKCQFYIQDMVQVGDTWWMISDTNKLFFWEKGAEEICCVGEVPEQPKWNMPNEKLGYWRETLYFVPKNAKYPASFDIVQKKFGKIEGKVIESGFCCRDIIFFENKIFYLPYYGSSILEYDLEQKVWREYTDGIEKLHAGAKGKFYESFYACKKEQKILWMTATDTNRILKFNMESGESEVFVLGDEKMAYSGIEIEGDKIWLAEVHTGDLVLWDRGSSGYQRFPMPQEFCTWQSSWRRNLAHKQIFSVGQWIVTVPEFSNMAVKFHKNTYEMKPLAKEFWQEEQKNGTDYLYLGMTGYSGRISETELVIQRESDAAFIVVDPETEKYQVYHPVLSKDTLEEILAGEDGFEKIHKNAEFSCRENRYFSLNGFLDALTENRLGQVLERQKEENRNLAVNLDGTCGEKVHAFIKGQLEKEV